MDTARWEQVQALFHQAAELEACDRRAYLEAPCHGDPSLMADVCAMLAADEQGESVLDNGLADLANSFLGNAGADLPYKEFGAYSVIRLLGEGGMGVVYLAQRKDIGGQVAIKVLRDAWLSPARRDRFAAEQRLLAQLDHPSIARLYEANTLAEGIPYFVMEYVDGQLLTEYCRNQHSSAVECLRLFRQVCEAVQYAHSRAVIHRDLKPSNILVKADGTVRLLDFGIAKQMDTFAAVNEHTRTGLRLMTPAYAAPEQVRGDQLGAQTDVYSLGVVLYQLLAGRLPFDLTDLTPVEAATVVLEHEPSPPSEFDNNRFADKAAWADLDVLCLKAMHRDPARRYSSVEALVRDVDHFLAAEPLEARPDSLRYKLGKFIRRNQRAVLAAAAVLVLVVGLIGYFTVRLARARDAALAEAARTQRIQGFTTNLFQGGDEAAGPADNLRVTTLLDRGVQEAQGLGKDPAQQADMYETLGAIYQKLGKLDKAEPLLLSALELRRKVFGPQSPETAGSLVGLGLLRDAQAQYDDAEKLMEQALAIAAKLPPHNPLTGKATAGLGRVLEDRGDYRRAIPVLQEAVRLQSLDGANQADKAATLSELANCHFYVGEYKISENLNRQVLQIQQKLYGDHHPLIADTLINLGAIQYELGNYADAERFDRQALDITQAWYGDQHPETASEMTILARALVAQKRPDEASTLLQRALAIQEHVYGEVHPRVASALNELGKLAQNQGKLDDAEKDFQRMEDIYRSVYGDAHYLIAIAMSNRASVYMDRKEYARAEQVFREVVARFTKALSADHLNTGIARIKLGRALLRQHKYSSAVVESLAGHDILTGQATPSISWLKNARADLVEEYDAMKQPELAARFRSDGSDATAGVNVAAK